MLIPCLVPDAASYSSCEFIRQAFYQYVGYIVHVGGALNPSIHKKTSCQSGTFKSLPIPLPSSSITGSHNHTMRFLILDINLVALASLSEGSLQRINKRKQ